MSPAARWQSAFKDKAKGPTAKADKGWPRFETEVKAQSLTLPYPPSTNRIWRKGRKGIIYAAPAAVAFKEAAAWSARAARVLGVAKPSTVEVRIYLHRPAKRGDLDNGIKIVLDALNGMAWEDDSQIESIQAWRFESKDNPRTFVVWESRLPQQHHPSCSCRECVVI